MTSHEDRQTDASSTPRLTHLDESGNIHMVDVTEQSETTREAVAKARVRMQPETVRLIETNAVAKGSVWKWRRSPVLWPPSRRLS